MSDLSHQKISDNVDYEAMGYAFYKSGGVGYGVVNEGFMLGFMLALAEYPSGHPTCYKTIKQALSSYFCDEKVKQYLDLARAFRENQTEWVRWPNLALE